MTRLSANTPTAQRAVTSNPATSRADANVAPNDGGSHSSAIADGVPDIGGLSLAESDVIDHGSLSPHRNRGHPRTAEIVTIPQTVMNITVHANNSPVHIHGGSGSAPGQLQGTRSVTRMLRGGMPNVPPPRRVLRPTADGATIPPVVGRAPTPASPAMTGSPQLQSLPDTPVSEAASLPAVDSSVDDDADEYIAPPNPEHKGKWHAVVAGHRVGVWSDWLAMARYVTGVSGNHHKSFPSRAEALMYYYNAKVDGAVVVIAE